MRMKHWRYIRILSFICVALLCSFSSVGYCADNEDPLAAMYREPGRYITYGGVGTGSVVMLDRNSINVHLYNPPYYIIAFDSRLHFCPGTVNTSNKMPTEFVREPQIKRFRYDYNQKKIYIESVKNGQTYWKYIDPDAEDKSTASGWGPAMSGAEIAFYLAYQMPFFDPPYGSYSKDFIVNKRSYLPLDKLPGDGRHYYDHQKKQIITKKPNYP